jgi:hypothetical protein
MSGVETLVGTAALMVGVCLLSVSWRRRRDTKVHLLLGGWGLITAGFVAFSHGWGAEVGIAFATLAFSCVAYAIVAGGAEFRRGRDRAPREAALEPEDRPTNWRRGIANSLLAIALAGIASIGVGVAIAVATPIAVYDRIMLGGILVPILWGGGMAWTLSDARLLRATIVLITVSLVSYAIAFLPKVLG